MFEIYAKKNKEQTYFRCQVDQNVDFFGIRKVKLNNLFQAVFNF